jgi:hypothetical protein
VTDPLLLISLITVLTAAALLKAWNGWLDVKRMEFSIRRPADGSALTSARIELADLKERVRRLEAISEGSDPRE